MKVSEGERKPVHLQIGTSADAQAPFLLGYPYVVNRFITCMVQR